MALLIQLRRSFSAIAAILAFAPVCSWTLQPPHGRDAARDVQFADAIDGALPESGNRDASEVAPADTIDAQPDVVDVPLPPVDADTGTGCGGASCLIASVCYAGGALNPVNHCQGCVASTSATSWTNLVVSCDDGDFCTDGDVCVSGACAPGPPRMCPVDPTPCMMAACRSGACGSFPVADNTLCMGSAGAMARYRCFGGMCIDLHNCCTSTTTCSTVIGTICSSLGCCADCGANLCSTWNG